MIFWTTLYLLLAAFDVYCTQKAGPEHELNPFYKKLMAWLGNWGGALLGVGISSCVLVGLCYAFAAAQFLAFLTGMRALLAILQYKAHF